jgi:hypothetical protein
MDSTTKANANVMTMNRSMTEEGIRNEERVGDGGRFYTL